MKKCYVFFGLLMLFSEAYSQIPSTPAYFEVFQEYKNPIPVDSLAQDTIAFRNNLGSIPRDSFYGVYAITVVDTTNLDSVFISLGTDTSGTNIFTKKFHFTHTTYVAHNASYSRDYFNVYIKLQDVYALASFKSKVVLKSINGKKSDPVYYSFP